MAQIKPLSYQGSLFYPVTIVEAIVQASGENANKNLETILNEMRQGLAITVDDALSTTSENPVQNKVVKGALDNKADKSATVSTVTWDGNNKKLTKTVNGTTSDVVTATTIKTALNLVKGDVGLGNVTNDAQVKRSEMGVANGVATLDSGGKVPSSQLPSYVDDVVEGVHLPDENFYAGTIPLIEEGYLKASTGAFFLDAGYTTLASKDSSIYCWDRESLMWYKYNPSSDKWEVVGSSLPETGLIPRESGKIYVDRWSNKTYRWSSTMYVEISTSLALGETPSTAFPGSRGVALETRTSHTSSENATLAWNTLIKIATANGIAINVKLPANPNTDTKVTSVGNHYAPAADANSELTAVISGTAGAYALNTEYTVLTGVKAQRDAKGHVTGLTFTAQKIKDTHVTPGNAALKVGSNSGTATQAITMNEGTARTLQVKGDGTYITGAVSGNSNEAVVTLSHAAPSNGSAIATSNGTASAYAVNTEYEVVTGVTVSADAKGHITGVSTTRQKVKDTNTTYSAMTQSEASTGTATTGRTINAKVLADTISEKAVTVGTLSNTDYNDITSNIISQS